MRMVHPIHADAKTCTPWRTEFAELVYRELTGDMRRLDDLTGVPDSTSEIQCDKEPSRVSTGKLGQESPPEMGRGQRGCDWQFTCDRLLESARRDGDECHLAVEIL